MNLAEKMVVWSGASRVEKKAVELVEWTVFGWAVNMAGWKVASSVARKVDQTGASQAGKLVDLWVEGKAAALAEQKGRRWILDSLSARKCNCPQNHRHQKLHRIRTLFHILCSGYWL